MIRRRILAFALLMVVPVALAVWPAVLACTFVFGERATASVARCVDHGEGRTGGLTCTGTWRTEDGDTGSGEIDGAREDDAGTDVPVRIGPLGVYAGGFARHWAPFLFVVPALITPLLVLWAVRRSAPQDPRP